ncbi:MAG: amino acid ABC transporter substrate-binding protein, partial [Crenarchaeota archaeon]|nr:amino acid ABC transporter substrate-binding protein [Thermoproteota archaeon]
VASVAFLKIGQPLEYSISELTFYTEQFPPCNFMKNGSLQGIAVELLTEITDNMGNKITPNQIQLTTWKEAYQIIKNEDNVVLFSMAKLPEREQMFKWAGPLFTDTYVLFAKLDNNFTITNAQDLQEHKIGVITDSAGIFQLLDAGIQESQMVYDTNASRLIDKLKNGEIDFWCYPQTVGRTITQQLTGDYYAFEIVFELSYYDYYYAFSKNVPDSTVNSFQQAIDSIKQEIDNTGKSSYEKILEHYIPTNEISNSP